MLWYFARTQQRQQTQLQCGALQPKHPCKSNPSAFSNPTANIPHCLRRGSHAAVVTRALREGSPVCGVAAHALHHSFESSLLRFARARTGQHAHNTRHSNAGIYWRACSCSSCVMMLPLVVSTSCGASMSVLASTTRAVACSTLYLRTRHCSQRRRDACHHTTHTMHHTTHIMQLSKPSPLPVLTRTVVASCVRQPRPMPYAASSVGLTGC